MYVVVPTCSFCGRVQDEDGSAGGRWVSLPDYRAKYGLLPGEIWGAHTDCPECDRQVEQFVTRTRGIEGSSLFA